MQRNQLLVLAVVALVAISAAVYLQSPGQRQTAVERSAFVPGLSENINSVTQIRLKRAGDETIATLELGEEGWTLGERDDYPADAGKIRSLLLDLSEAKILEQKTSNPDLYAKLGVQDITANEATGTQVEIDGLEAPVTVILGQTAATLEATYARVAGDPHSVAISGRVEPEIATTDWLDPAIIDIAGDRVQRVTIIRPDGDNVEAVKAERDAGLEVRNLPKNAELKSANEASSLSGGLAGLELDDVVSSSLLDAEAPDWTTSEFHTFDGLALRVRSLEANEEYYVTIETSFDEQQARAHYQPAPAEEETADGEGETAEAESAPEADEIDPAMFAETQSEAERLQAALQGRAFKISQFEYDDLTRPLSAMLKEEEE